VKKAMKKAAKKAPGKVAKKAPSRVPRPPNLPPRALPAFPLKALQALLPAAFAEDEGAGDVTSEATLDAAHRSKGALLCKEDGVLAGVPVLEAVFCHRGLAPRIEWLAAEGDAIRAGQILARVEGETRGLLVCERIILNFMQRLCGIATASRRFAEAAGGIDGKARVLDTRKTLPAYRELDKYAVAAGGGVNHRMGLHDQILIKDNHAAACGSVRAAVDRAAKRFGRAYKIEAEVRTLEEIETLLDAPVDILLLDNMDDKTLKRAVALVRAHAPHIKLEASGNLDLARVKRLRNSGVDFFSVGALTHSVKALDLSLKIGAFVPGGIHG
jgi:nicotinate-nucleotide pyrophosphorylase (carboxylating)